MNGKEVPHTSYHTPLTLYRSLLAHSATSVLRSACVRHIVLVPKKSALPASDTCDAGKTAYWWCISGRGESEERGGDGGWYEKKEGIVARKRGAWRE